MKVLAETPHLRLVERAGWTYAERPREVRVVAIVAKTVDGKLLFVEQHRTPLGRSTIELPAGLCGDNGESENPIEAARRELMEETGYEPGRLEAVATGASSPGLTSEVVTFFLATGCRRVADGGGVDDEIITVHEIENWAAPRWLRNSEKNGIAVSANVWAGLYFEAEHAARSAGDAEGET